MTIAIDERTTASTTISVATVIWAALLSFSLLLYTRPDLFPSAVRYPQSAVIPLADWVSAIMRWLRDNLTWLTRGITDVLSIPLNWSFNLLAKGWKLGPEADAAVLPRLSWVGIVVAFFLVGYKLGGQRLAALAAACMLYIALFGQWESSMLTLALIAISVPLCIGLGLMLGIIADGKPGIPNRAGSGPDICRSENWGRNVRLCFAPRTPPCRPPSEWPSPTSVAGTRNCACRNGRRALRGETSRSGSTYQRAFCGPYPAVPFNFASSVRVSCTSGFTVCALKSKRQPAAVNSSGNGRDPPSAKPAW